MSDIVDSKSLEKQIEEATDLASVLAIYGKANGHFTDFSSLQEAAGKRLLELGETEKALEFMLLAGQSRNAKMLLQFAEAMTERVGNLNMLVQYLNESAEKFYKGTNHFMESADVIKRSFSLADSVANEMKVTANKILQASENMSSRGGGW